MNRPRARSRSRILGTLGPTATAPCGRRRCWCPRRAAASVDPRAVVAHRRARRTGSGLGGSRRVPRGGRIVRPDRRTRPGTPASHPRRVRRPVLRVLRAPGRSRHAPPGAAPRTRPGGVGAVTKITTGVWAARRNNIGPKGRVRAGLSLVPRGEFSIVIAGLAVTANAEPQLGPLAASYVLILAIAGSLAMRYADHPLLHHMALRRVR